MTEAEAGSGGLEKGEVLKANTPGPEQIQVGMRVVSVDGQEIGRVKEVGADEFLVDRPMARDVFVPYEVVVGLPTPGERVRGGPQRSEQVMLSISAAHVDQQHWRHP